MTRATETITVAEFHSLEALAMTERELLENVVEMARRLNWLVYRAWSSQHSEAGNSTMTLYKLSGPAVLGTPRTRQREVTSMRPKSTPRICSIDGCDSHAYGHGWCLKHYTRWRNHGDPNTVKVRFPPLRNRSVADRFWEKVTRGPDCWEWQGSLDGHGYGQMRIAGAAVLAHRVSYELAYGPIPNGILILHRCDNPLCVRPDHLAQGTHQDNSRDMAAKGRWRNQTGGPK